MDDPDCMDCGYKEYEHDDEDDSPTCGGFASQLWPYDEGGDKWRALTQQPMPARKRDDRCRRLRLPKKLIARLQLPAELSHSQMAWLANLPYAMLGKDAWTVCTELESAGCRAYIPIDTWIRADAERGL